MDDDERVDETPLIPLTTNRSTPTTPELSLQTVLKPLTISCTAYGQHVNGRDRDIQISPRSYDSDLRVAGLAIDAQVRTPTTLLIAFYPDRHFAPRLDPQLNKIQIIKLFRSYLIAPLLLLGAACAYFYR
jgi:hypothetical protein